MGIAVFSRQARARVNEHYRWQQEQNRLTPIQAARYARMLHDDAVRLAELEAAADVRPSQTPALGVTEGREEVPLELKHGRSRGGHFHFYYLRTGPARIRVVAAVPTRSNQYPRLLEDLLTEKGVAQIRLVESMKAPAPKGLGTDVSAEFLVPEGPTE